MCPEDKYMSRRLESVILTRGRPRVSKRGFLKTNFIKTTFHGNKKKVIKTVCFLVGTVLGTTLGTLPRDVRSTYWPFQVLKCYLEQKLKLNLKLAASSPNMV